MKHVSTFRIFENNSLNPEQVEFIKSCTKYPWTFNPSTGIVNVEGPFDCSNYKGRGLENFLGIQFGEVQGNFHCGGNKLVSLEGGPKIVRGHFDCRSNNLTTLKGGPEEISGNYLCMNNDLVSLEGSPKVIRGSFYCDGNKLTSLKGGPEEVRSSWFDCSKNPLASLEGAPKKIDGRFKCDEFEAMYSEWNQVGWGKMFKRGSEKIQKLVLPLLNATTLNQEIEKDPEGMMMKLKSFWNSPNFSSVRKDLVIPARYKEEMDTLGDLSNLGF